MLKLGPRHYLAETIEDLPKPRRGKIFLDCETRYRSDDPEDLNGDAFYPYLGDRACLWSIAFDDDGPAVAIPYRMRSSPNMDVKVVQSWLRDVLMTADEWVNSNVKFDAHFAWVDDAPFPDKLKLVDTVSLAKLIDSDRFGHGLKDLAREWLNVDYSSLDRISAFLEGYKLPRNKKAKCYALCPSDMLGYYGCDDVLHNRDLYRYMIKALPEEVQDTWEMEQKLAPVLWDMEHEGLLTNETELKKERLLSLHRQIAVATRIHELTGMEWVDSAPWMHRLIVGKWGLPILANNGKTGNPTFNYDALQLYLAHPEVVLDPVKFEAVQSVLAMRDEETYCSLFLDTYLTMRDSNGRVHPIYNPIVRTGRMSCSDPNIQQSDIRAKRLIRTDGPDMAFIDSDASQVEFRFIAHYINHEGWIAAYNADKKTDAHAWVAGLCGIKRKPAKNVNFAQAFGAGKRKTIAMLMGDPEIIAEATAIVERLLAEGKIKPEQRLQAFKQFAQQRGEFVYRTYHEKLPTLKQTSDKAEAICRSRGYIRNLYGRRRHLTTKGAHKAFNTICQGGAMDCIKRGMIRTSPRYVPELKHDGIRLVGNIHDNVIHHGHVDACKKWQPWIVEQLELPVPGLRVPILWESAVRQERLEALVV